MCLISTPLLALGYYGKKHINHIQEKIYTCVHIRPMSLLIGILTNLLILICFAWYLHPYYECFVMKYSRYRMFYFAILIQAFAFVLILFVSGFLEFFNPIRTFIQKIGRASFIIMYSHLIVKAALIKATDGDSSTFLFILISCMLGCFINHLAKGYKYLAIVCGCG